MKILFDLGHPGHVHLFKNLIKGLKKRNHHIMVVIRERENAVRGLIEKMGIGYEELYPNAKGIIPKAITMFKNDYSLLKISKRFNPDIFVSVTSPYSAHTSAITSKPHITFADTEDAKLILRLTIPFTGVIVTEDSYLGKLPPKKHVSLPTWRPLAYLHPKYFQPNEEVLEYLGVKKGEKFFIVRFSAWDASHDWKLKVGISWEDRNKFVRRLSEFGEVFISSEEKLENRIEYGKILDIPPYLFHDALAFSSGYIGEGHMSAREAVCFGIPSILISPRAKLESVIMDLVNKDFIRLFHNYRGLQEKNFESLLKFQRERVMKEVENLVDLNEFFVWLIENYPESMEEWRENKEKITDKFKFGK